MSLRSILNNFLRVLAFKRSTPPPHHGSIHFSTDAFSKLCEAIESSSTRTRHETIIYLLGTIHEYHVSVEEIFHPHAITTSGSFNVPAREIARLVRHAADTDKIVVGQIHTHPQKAYHSDGDFLGMDIRYPGYVSIVLPRYGEYLPRLRGIDVLQFSADHGWCPIDSSVIRISGKHV